MHQPQFREICGQSLRAFSSGLSSPSMCQPSMSCHIPLVHRELFLSPNIAIRGNFLSWMARNDNSTLLHASHMQAYRPLCHLCYQRIDLTIQTEAIDEEEILSVFVFAIHAMHN